MADAGELEPLTRPSPLGPDEIVEMLQDFVEEEDRLLDATLSEQRRTDIEWTGKVETLISSSVKQQNKLEERIAAFRSDVDSQQGSMQKVAKEVRDLMQKYPREFVDHQHTQLEQDADEAAAMADLMASMKTSRMVLSPSEPPKDCLEMKKAPARDYVSKVRARSCLGRIICNPIFDIICTIVIGSNAIYIGIQVEYAINNIGSEAPSWHQALEMFFFGFYLVELLLKLIVHRVQFFTPTNPDWRWNIFDFLLVLSAIYDLIHDMMDLGGSGANFMWMRLLRLMKMMKLMRVVRVMRFFRDLRLMMSLIGQSLRSLLWALLMLFLIMYLFGLCFLQGVTGYLEETKNVDPKVKLAIEKYWDSVYDAVCTLLMSITRGIDWRLASEPLEEVGQIYHVLFLLYISFTMFAVLNIITGIFVEASFNTVAGDRANVASEAMKLAAAEGNKIHLLLAQWSTASDLLSEEDFLKACAEDDRLQPTIAEMEITTEELDEMFKDLASRRNIGGMVKVKDLATALMMLKGPAQAMDIVQLNFGCSKYEESIENFMHFVEEQFLCMRRALQYRLQHHSTYVMPLQDRLKAARSMPLKVFSL